MGYYIHDVQGYVADGPSISGWRKLRDEVLLPQGGPATNQFVEEGATEQLVTFRQELAKMKTRNLRIMSSLVALRAAVEKASAVVILSNGTPEVSGPDDLPDNKAYLVD